MILKELKEIFDQLPDDVTLSYGVGCPASWRGSYDEVMFPVEESILAGECKKNIKMAFTDTFYGYKGGKYKFSDYTPVNFESDGSAYTDGDYREDMISKIIGARQEFDRDVFLVKLMVATGNDEG